MTVRNVLDRMCEMWLDTDMTNISAATALANKTTEQLCLALLVLDAKTWAGRTAEERMVFGWLAEEIEARNPHTNEIMEAWAADLDTEATYAETLCAAVMG